jgi:long-chain fatty acid transport protein
MRWVGAAFAILVMAGDAGASPLELYGFGARSPAMAGTGVATTIGYESVYLNPAGLADVKRKRLSVGGILGDIALELNRGAPGQEFEAAASDPSATIFGGEIPLPLGGKLKDRVGIGIGLHIPTGSLVRVDVPLPGDPGFALLQTRSNVIGIQLAAGVKLSDRWRVGVGFLALAALRGTIDVTVDGAGRFSSLSEQRVISDFAPILGARYLMNDSWRFGATVRGASRSDYDILVTNDLADSLPLSIPTLRIKGAAQYDPLIVAAEAAFRVNRYLVLGAQLDYQRWSHFPPPTENPLENQAPIEDPGFSDTVVPRVSAEVGFSSGDLDLRWRAGAAFIKSPAPHMNGRQALLDNDRILGSFGFGIHATRWRVPLYLDAWFQMHQLLSRRHTKDLTTFFEPGEVVPFSTIDTGGSIVVGGVMVGVDL